MSVSRWNAWPSAPVAVLEQREAVEAHAVAVLQHAGGLGQRRVRERHAPCHAPTTSRRGSPRRVVVPEQLARPATRTVREQVLVHLVGARAPSAAPRRPRRRRPRSIRSTGASRSTQVRSSSTPRMPSMPDLTARQAVCDADERTSRSHHAPPGGRHGHARPRDPRRHRRRRHRRAGAHRRRRDHRRRRHRGRARSTAPARRRSTPTARSSRRASSTSTRTTTARSPGTRCSRRRAGTASPPW